MVSVRPNARCRSDGGGRRISDAGAERFAVPCSLLRACSTSAFRGVRWRTSSSAISSASVDASQHDRRRSSGSERAVDPDLRQAWCVAGTEQGAPANVNAVNTGTHPARNSAGVRRILRWVWQAILALRKERPAMRSASGTRSMASTHDCSDAYWRAKRERLHSHAVSVRRRLGLAPSPHVAEARPGPQLPPKAL